MSSKKLFEEVFNEVDLNSIENIVGGKTEDLQCDLWWLACQQNQVFPCGTQSSSACELWKKYCK